MKTLFRLVFSLLFLFVLNNLYAQRNEVSFNANWQFTGGSVTGETINETVNIPHTWNAFDAQEGLSYYRGTGTYIKTFIPEKSWQNKRVFIRFEGVMTTAKVYINNKLIGEHRGGYSAFIFEINKYLNYKKENTIKVVANNEYTLDVLPLFGDFNIYGGIYRPVKLIVTPQVCISPLDFASPGIYLKQKSVTASLADIDVIVKLSNKRESSQKLQVKVSLFDAEQNELQSVATPLNIEVGETGFTQNLQIQNPHLWNGKADAYLYSVKTELFANGKTIDSGVQPLGLRFFRVDPNEGFFLNGKHIPLHGVSRHQDRFNKGSAISDADHRQDMEIMLEMGINSLRLAHYQHAETMYDLTDSAGIVVWAEMPWVGGPGGFTGGSNGYENTEAFHSNAKQQLTELIRQNFNHPSICFWSIFNEIQNPEDNSPVDFINELNKLVKKEDPSRISVGASMLDPKENIHDITDAIAWNRYFGWYYKQPADIGKFLDETHRNYPNLCIGISEYGAGASIYQHTQKLKRPNPFGSPHPEEWQGYYHEQHLKAFNERPFVWGTFLWNMFDFGSHFRREGDHYGINDKGLVTFDRKTKKDAFYFFKANWSDQPVLHITSKRFIFREKEKTNVKVYSNLNKVTLFVNGKEISSKSPVDGIVEWKNIVLNKGNNGIKVSASQKGKIYTDSCVWALDTAFGTKQIAKIYDMLQYLWGPIIVVFLLLIWLWHTAWRNREKKPRPKRNLAKITFFIVLLIELLLMAVKILAASQLG